MAGSESGKTAVPIPNAAPNTSSNAAAASTQVTAQRHPRGPAAAAIGHVNGRHTPVAMIQQRIPPRVNTGITVTVTNGPIRLIVDGQNASNGTVEIRGRNEIRLGSGTHRVNLKGVTQTSPGNGNNLRVQAFDGTTLLATSNTFSVSSIPQNWRCTLLRRLDDPADPTSAVGFVVQDRWNSDSGVVADLNEAQISERIESVGGTGPFAAIRNVNSGYLPANLFTEDTHSAAPRRALNSAGVLNQQQASMFLDRRTGAMDIPMTRSGYNLNFSITQRRRHPGSFIFELTKRGAAATALGVATAAGHGRISPPSSIVP
ncbi:MAG: hypothetical protein ACRCYO_16920 [Bacteroidia bacterium]